MDRLRSLTFWKRRKEFTHGSTPLSPSDRSLLPAGGAALHRLRGRAVPSPLGVWRLPRPGSRDSPVFGTRDRLFLRRSRHGSERVFGAVYGRDGGSRGGCAGDGAAHGRGSGGRRDRHAGRDGDPAHPGEGAAGLPRLRLQVPAGARSPDGVMKRARWMDLPEAAASIPDGASIAPGGFMLGRAPMALVFELVRQQRRGLHVISLPNPLPAEILVAAGAASKVEFLFAAISLANRVRPMPVLKRAIEAGSLGWTEHDGYRVVQRFRAAAMGLPFLPVPDAEASAVSRLDPLPR